MSVPNIPYASYRVRTADNHQGTVDVYDGLVVEVSESLVEYLGRQWCEVRPHLTQAEARPPSTRLRL